MSLVYAHLGCTKTDITRWAQNPLETHGHTKKRRISVVLSAAELFDLSAEEAETLANRSGLSLHPRKNLLPKLLGHCGSDRRRRLYRVVSERMLQYYAAGTEPTKQALLAVGITLELPREKLEGLLRSYGYCLSESLACDMVVRWYLDNCGTPTSALLDEINQTLDELCLPLLMTKAINRNN